MYVYLYIYIVLNLFKQIYVVMMANTSPFQSCLFYTHGTGGKSSVTARLLDKCPKTFHFGNCLA